jgi:Mg-chelatase subunit ChlD
MPRRTVTPSAIAHICLLLDASGSMQLISDDALGSVNTFISDAQQDSALIDSRFTLITFNHKWIAVLREAQSVDAIKPITADEYRCTGMTPLYDALARAIGILDAAVGATQGGATSPEKTVLAIVTDGMENASCGYTLEDIKALIKARQKAGWMVVFLGAGLDVAAQGYALGIAAANDNVVAFQGSAGLRRALSGLTRRIANEYAESQLGDDCEPGEETKS